MKTFHVVVYGCQMNYSDAARIKAVLTNCGRVHVDNIEQADIVIVDTCSVRQKSEDKVWGLLKELSNLKKPSPLTPLPNTPPSPQESLRSGQASSLGEGNTLLQSNNSTGPKIWLTGCMIQHNLNLKKTRTSKSKKYQLGNFVGTVMGKTPKIVGLEEMDKDEELKTIVKAYALGKEDRTDELLYINHAFNPLFKQMQRSFPNVELFFRIHDTGMLPYIMQKLGYTVDYDIDVVNEYTGIIPHDANMMLAENTKTAYVPISTGCSQFCAYCIVPYARGLEKHRPVDEIYAEVKTHLANGVEEIVLLGQIVNKHPDFYEILKTVSEMPGVRWLRYTSPYPTYYNANIFALHQDKENICPHIHMPIQSGSNKVLKKMFRGYTKEDCREFIDAIHAGKRPISITTDMIVGFCDETEEDFQESLAMVEYGQFDMIYMGIYSPRPGTYGAKKYEDSVPLEVKRARRARMNALLTQISRKNNLEEVGQQRLMMVREFQKEQMTGYTDNMKNIVISLQSDEVEHNPVQVGTFVDIQVLSSKPFTLYGKVV